MLAVNRRFVYATDFSSADIVAVDLTDGTIQQPVAATLTADPTGGSGVSGAGGLCAAGRYLYASAREPCFLAGICRAQGRGKGQM